MGQIEIEARAANKRGPIIGRDEVPVANNFYVTLYCAIRPYSYDFSFTYHHMYYVCRRSFWEVAPVLTVGLFVSGSGQLQRATAAVQLSGQVLRRMPSAPQVKFRPPLAMSQRSVYSSQLVSE